MKKIISIVLVILMTLSFAVPVSAQENIKSAEEWELTDGGKKLCFGTNEYVIYPDFNAEHFLPEEAFVFEGAVTDDDLVEYDVVVPQSNNDIVCLAFTDNWLESSVYVTAEGKKTLDAFQDGMYGHARIYNYHVWNGGYGELELEFLAELDKFKGEVIDMNVNSLSEMDICPVYVYDITDTIEHHHGDIYIDGDVYYYVNYDALDNSYFDADGYFSYRKGTVSVLKLDSEAVSVLNEVSNDLEERFTEYEYSESNGFDFGFSSDGIFSSETASVIFWVFSGIFGFAIPLAIGVLGIVLALSKKPGKNKRWLVLPVLSLLWMLVFTAIILVIII